MQYILLKGGHLKVKSTLIKNAAILVIGILVVSQVSQNVTAEDLNSVSGVVEMQEKTIHVTVYYYEGEEEWGHYIFDITVEALPILEDLAGFPYPYDFDVKIYPKRSEETRMWNAQNLLYQGIWINRDKFTPENIKSWDITAVLIHENVHYWSNDAIYEKPWLKEGYAELFACLALERMDRKEAAVHRRNGWSHTVEENRYYNIPLDMFEYEAAGPGNATTLLAYSKSALCCYEIYEKYGIAPIQKINQYLYQNGMVADSFMYMDLLEDYTGEDQKEFFTKWVFPKNIDIQEGQNVQDKIEELEEQADELLSYIEETYGFSEIIDFVEFQMHLTTQIKMARSCIEEYDFEKALQIINEEIEGVDNAMSEFDGHALRYFEAEEYYNSLKFTLGEIPEDELLVARDSLLSFNFELFSEQLAAFYDNMEKLETYDRLYTEWCMGNNCTALDPVGELLSHVSYKEVVSRADRTVTAVQEYEAMQKELADCDWFTLIGMVVLGKSEEDFESDLENVEEEIKNGSLEDSLSILAQIHNNLSTSRKCGTGVVLGVVFVLIFASFIVVKKRKTKHR